MKMIVEKQMECRLAGETKVLGENLPQLHFCPSQNKPATNCPSYGAATDGNGQGIQYSMEKLLHKVGVKTLREELLVSACCLINATSFLG
jgi:hypothetical protein